jgi:metal-responsive CopG/Arc/MetJ family transcriptional regulator
MPRFKSGGPLSSRDPSTKPIAVRLPADLVAAIDATCIEQGITQSELLRGLVSQWVYGKTQLAGPDEGYAEARSMASRLAHAALKQALTSLPDSHEGARTMLQGFYAEQATQKRKR